MIGHLPSTIRSQVLPERLRPAAPGEAARTVARPQADGIAQVGGAGDAVRDCRNLRAFCVAFLKGAHAQFRIGVPHASGG
jgi:hypothetical protein